MRHVTASGVVGGRGRDCIDPLLPDGGGTPQLSGETVKNGGGCVR
jgi:hypothetical protein